MTSKLARCSRSCGNRHRGAARLDLASEERIPVGSMHGSGGVVFNSPVQHFRRLVKKRGSDDDGHRGHGAQFFPGPACFSQ